MTAAPPIVECPTCAGRCFVAMKLCPTCRGAGRVEIGDDVGRRSLVSGLVVVGKTEGQAK